jgi:hypothetical protein
MGLLWGPFLFDDHFSQPDARLPFAVMAIGPRAQRRNASARTIALKLAGLTAIVALPAPVLAQKGPGPFELGGFSQFDQRQDPSSVALPGAGQVGPATCAENQSELPVLQQCDTRAKEDVQRVLDLSTGRFREDFARDADSNGVQRDTQRTKQPKPFGNMPQMSKICR